MIEPDVVVVASGQGPLVEVPAARAVVAADGGLDRAASLGLAVDVVVGDLDSVSPAELERAEANGVRVTQPVEDIAVPGTVQEVLAARLDRLDGPAKRAIQVASVVGRQFSAAQLSALLAEEGVHVANAALPSR